MSAAQARLRLKPADCPERVVNGIESLGGQSLRQSNRLKPRLQSLAASGWADILAWLGLALAALAICWPLGLTNRILAGIDAFTYFTPYWDYRMAALRSGDVPLWNPYLFLGVPFLANPQAAVLYPLHWPLSWLTAEKALAWSAVLHAWLAAGFTYTFARRSFGLTRPAAWLSGLLFGLGGFTLARCENINQLNALAWLPALLWLYDEVLRSLARPDGTAADDNQAHRNRASPALPGTCSGGQRRGKCAPKRNQRPPVGSAGASVRRFAPLPTQPANPEGGWRTALIPGWRRAIFRANDHAGCAATAPAGENAAEHPERSGAESKGRSGLWSRSYPFGRLPAPFGRGLCRAGSSTTPEALPRLRSGCSLIFRAIHRQQWLRWSVALSLAIALQTLAGHTQTTFINLAGLGLYALAGIRWQRPGKTDLTAGPSPRLSQDAYPATGRNVSWRTDPRSMTSAGRSAFGMLARPLAPLLAVVPALLLSAAQLLPTLELNGLGLRTGGLPFRQAVSFSLRPRLLAQTLLPPFGGGLAEAFASEGYAEFVGYIGIAGLTLAGLALWRAWRRRDAPQALRRMGGPALLAATGLFLALGAYNPVYYLLWRFVPGFDLFRAPARWLALFALGVAVLAGTGLDALQWGRVGRGRARTNADSSPSLWFEHPSDRKSQLPAQNRPAPTARQSTKVDFAKVAAVSTAGLLGLALIIFQQPPPFPTLAGWAAAAGLTAGLFWAVRRWPGPARGGLILLALLELWAAGRALPYTQATAPLAASLRNAPAALLAATADQPPAGRDRFLSLSDIRFDPGDLAELRALQADRLPAEAVERLVRAAKQVEVIAPNLPLRHRLPAVDGYDGGLLPLGRYVELQGLFLPAEQLVPDGRLREQLPAVPADRLLDLTGVRFVITDKQRDLWADDIYYDLELPAPLAAGATLDLDLTGYPAFSATALGVVAEGWGEASAGAALAEIVVTPAEGSPITLRWQAGPTTGTVPAPVRLALPAPLTPVHLALRPAAGGGVTIHGLSLIDERTGAHTTVTVSPRGDFRRIHTGDVKVYERTAAAGRAWLTHGVQPVPDDEAALAVLADPTFDPRANTVVVGGPVAVAPAPAGPDESVAITAASAERLALRAQVTSPALLVLADTFYPGWEATVDGEPAPILRANLLFRAVALEPGTHEVIFTYRPRAWRLGVWISLVTLALLGGALAATYVTRLWYNTSCIYPFTRRHP